MENSTIEGFEDNYILKRIVYINSAAYGYAELELDRHLAIYGSNNAGKTSALSGTKIALFPEDSFRKCEKKFMFADSQGNYYDSDVSYGHYFPDARSFIVLEVENPRGKFSMVCYRANDYKYNRFFIPVEYSLLRPLFADDHGELNPELSIQLVSEFAKKHGGLRVTDHKELDYLMFGSRFDGTGKDRYCVFPLTDSKKETISAFKNIYQLAFDGGASSTSTLPDILATLVEMKRGRDKEKLDANLPALIESRAQLSEERDYLQELENVKPDFDEAWELLHEIKEQRHEYSKRFHGIALTLSERKERVIPEIQRVKASYSEVKAALEKTQAIIREHAKTLERNRGEYQKAGKILKSKQTKLRLAKELRATYSEPSDTELMRDIEDRIEVEKQELKVHSEAANIQESLSRYIASQNTLRARRDGLKQSIDDANRLLFSILDNDHTVDVLNTINPVFAQVHYNLRPEHKGVVNEFASLFSFDARQRLTLNGSVIHDDLMKRSFDAETNHVALKAEYEDVISKLEDLDSKIASAQARIKTNDTQGVIQDYMDRIKDLEDRLDKMRSIPYLESDISEIEKDIEVMAQEGKALSEMIAPGGDLNTQLEKQRVEPAALNERLDKLDREAGSIEQMLAQLRTIEEYSLAPLNVKGYEDVESTTETIQSLKQTGSVLKSSIELLKEKHRFLIDRLKHDDIDPHHASFSLDQCINNIAKLANTFNEFEARRVKLKSEVAGHNEMLNSQLNELKESRDTVRREVSDINRALNEYKISNLSEIGINVSFEPSFENIMATLDKHDIGGDSLLDVEFYEKLSSLVGVKYYDKKTGRVRLRDIIKSVDYQYMKVGGNKAEKKGQSGGTTTTITAFVLSVLLGRISDTDTKLKMPIIVDEIGTLDTKNKRATIEKISGQGFSVFCANPTFLSAVTQAVGRYIYISRDKVRSPMVEHCHMKCIPDAVLEFGGVCSETA